MAGLAVAGSVYASVHGIRASLAIPVVAAFLFQTSVYLVAGFPAARGWFESRFSRPVLASMAVTASGTAYLIYALPAGVFAWISFLKLLALCLFVAYLFLLAPPRGNRLSWQDAAVMAVIAYPMISGVSLLRDIYPSPGPGIPQLDILGKLMLIALGAIVFLSLRPLEGSGFQFAISKTDLVEGVKNYLLFLPPGLALALAINFADWGPRPIEGWTYPFELFGTMLGFYAVVGLSEELFFRGILQNLLGASLGSPLGARLIASILFGLVHLPSRGFPNWRYAMIAALAGWFYGRAYARRRSVVASSVTHTLVVVTWRFLFR